MNKAIEENFVNSYIVKSKRERLLFELQGKKRRDGIGRFAHGAESLIDDSKIRLKGQYITKDLREIVAAANTGPCYVISWYEELDGKEFNKDDVPDLLFSGGMPSIAVFDNFAIIETEQEHGPAIKYFLQK